MAGIQHTGGLTISELSRRMADIKSPAFRSRLAQVLAQEAKKQVADEFREERDPYGNAWQPLMHRRGKILRKSGRMAASVATVPNADGFRIDIPVVYAAPHQYGTTKRAQRKARFQSTNGRGRFIKRSKAGRGKRSSRVQFIPGGAGGLIPRRQMIPDAKTGGLGPIWTKAFNEQSDAMITAHMEGK